MGTEDNGLSLEGLAKRLQALERENAELRHKVVSLEGSDTRGAEEEPLFESERRVSRRQLLSKVGAAAAGLVVAGALTQRDIREAQAAQLIGDSTQAFHGGVEGTNTNSSGYGVWGQDNAGYGVYGLSSSGQGVLGQSDTAIGVYGSSRDYNGVYGETGGASSKGVRGYNGSLTLGGSGVEGQNVAGDGVHGIGKGGANGVLGECSDGVGVKGQGQNGVYGVSSTAGGWAGVFGLNNASAGIGTYGEGTDGIGVQGVGKYGGFFQGSQAQLRLAPAGTAGKPTTGTHTKGEIYMDSAGSLFVCTGAGTPGTWKKINMKLV